MAGADASAASVPFLPRRRRTWRWPAPDLVREEERHFGATASLAADGGGGGPSAGEHGNGTAGLHGGEEDVELGWICGGRRWSSFAGASHSSLPSAAIPFPLLFSGVLSLSLCVGWDGVGDDEQRGPHATVAAAGSFGIPSYPEESGVDGKIAGVIKDTAAGGFYWETNGERDGGIYPVPSADGLRLSARGHWKPS
jgi:hypothetical protein